MKVFATSARLITFLFLIGSTCCMHPLLAQTKDTTESKQADGESKVVEKATEVEVMPEPPGGMQGFMQWVGQNYQYPQKAIDAGVIGSIQISFIVEKNGELSNFKILKDLGYGTGQAAVLMLKKAPKWSPGIQKGKPVRVLFTIPIALNLAG